MTFSSDDPWSERFSSILNPDEIRRRVVKPPVPVTGMANWQPKEAAHHIESALRAVFYPSEQCIDILMQWVAAARVHCAEMYGSRRAFIERVYQSQPPLPEFYFPLCLTGLAGTGKSALQEAFKRLAPQIDTVNTDDGTTFQLTSHRAITVRASSSPRDILFQLAQRDGPNRLLSGLVRKQAYRDGWALLLLDEFQFATQSSSASTRIAQMLMTACYVGIPTVYIANFSMLHKLKARNQEEQHRLLGRVRVLSPESNGSADWKTLLRWYREVAPDIFSFSPDADAERIHHLTGGVKRAVVALMRTAFEMEFSASGAVTLASLEQAYNSSGYAPYRADIESLAKLSGAFRQKRKDLWCPIAGVEANLESQWVQQRQSKVDKKALHASLTADERKVLDAVSIASKGTGKKPKKASVHPIRRGPDDAATLLKNLEMLDSKR
ncbi:P-loop NTPase family protein [Burkholderia pseudomallei]|uniref:hypothetical protein n=1 Tax=Burkholderia pseudomallei TaxID=28450 RepID=UPI0005DEF370|nr:hypothetical protein [Burkholderia pseudomallei]MBY7654633.1 hypothetical protein [Burkholderia pseudomallei]QUN84254.1 hypothetical protein KEX45_20455 [Burkholderia pseudomallei]QUN89204.1 hypothetical protein KEX46_27950 [Burkholderia pseudomallei]QUN96120.1 hypothetical protein KEX44_20545 [Burkholderia pseudomallei]QUO02151.1 hypothetical protein KEX42_20950 [Burkholderia pseudomallei]